jgi:hypothetical protein
MSELESKFPMTVKQFLAETEVHLARGDIILSQSPTLSSWLIRIATRSFFSHAALVFLLPHKDEGLDNTFLLESVSAGVGIANLQSYISGRSPSAAIAILRLNQPGLEPAFHKQVGGLMLNYVHAGYDYGRVIKLALSLLFGARLGWSGVRNGGRKSMQTAIETTKRKRRFRWVPPQFICSGFIQYGLVAAKLLRDEDAHGVVFRADLRPNDRNGLLAVTPEDIATSSIVDWRFAVRKGWVYRVENYDMARKTIFGD